MPAFADDEGGAVVNVAIATHVRGSLDGDRVNIERDTTCGGLGSSAAEHVLTEALRNADADLDEIA